MEKYAVRREFLKLKNKGLSYKQCQIELEVITFAGVICYGPTHYDLTLKAIKVFK
jgi:hypothetical protein